MSAVLLHTATVPAEPGCCALNATSCGAAVTISVEGCAAKTPAHVQSNGEGHRNVCIVPTSAHGTNPASAVMCGMKVAAVKTQANGEVDLDDFKEVMAQHEGNLAALMITYPSTYGFFDAEIGELCNLVHEAGGQVYMDGANMNAQARPPPQRPHDAGVVLSVTGQVSSGKCQV